MELNCKELHMKNNKIQSLRLAIDFLRDRNTDVQHLLEVSNKIHEYLNCPIIEPPDNYLQPQYFDNPVKFICEYMKIMHPLHGEIPFKLYDYQTEMVNAYHTHQKVIVNIARQMGGTSVTAAYLLWVALTKEKQTIMILTHKLALSKEILDRIIVMYDSLPNEKRTELIRKNSNGIEFVNGSRITTGVVNYCSVRGMSPTHIWVDSAAFISHKFGYDFWKSTGPITSTGTRIILTSTPYDSNGFFYDIWSDDYNNFHKIILPFDRHPDRGPGFEEEYREIMGNIKFDSEFRCKFR